MVHNLKTHIHIFFSKILSLMFLFNILFLQPIAQLTNNDQKWGKKTKQFNTLPRKNTINDYNGANWSKNYLVWFGLTISHSTLSYKSFFVEMCYIYTNKKVLQIIAQQQNMRARIGLEHTGMLYINKLKKFENRKKKIEKPQLQVREDLSFRANERESIPSVQHRIGFW